MWLLSTARAELQFFVSPESVPSPGFAILSHVWQQDEQTFQELQALRSKCASTGENPREFASEKIRKCCQLAQRHGYAWLWVDTCCIDKTSSAELSEAINSMFRYYSAAGICYAFLQDVPLRRTDNITDLFARSKWYTRGWTLQELIAPRVVLFLSESWDVLASKAELAVLIEDITGIPTTVLRLQRPLAYFSIAQRMSWAAKRITTRVEDRAYCLLGIFNINMPTLYGEGRRAFLRLQEEIMKQSPDTTLFAWERPGGSLTTL
ncbi:heterokaryon incompatibility protein-domain-containing protein [Daedaleopsis nitida]|nr:heterokaryon incompatibility protein-domain-containing protein [Daedaleopsis nitida]